MIKIKNSMIYGEYLQKARELLSLEYNCSPDDFLKNKNILTISVLKNGRRNYSSEKYFFHMVTMGGNTVITADECMQEFLNEYTQKVQGHWLFELPNLIPINNELNKYGYRLTPTYHMFLSDRYVKTEKDYPVKWFYDNEITPFYGDKRFPNAICPAFMPERPDRIVVCAYDNDTIMGMAGCSEDASNWHQIGIDVISEYRSRKIGTYLVILLKNKIIEHGDIPFYGTAVANYHSWNIALKSGFKPAWVEIGAEKI